MDNWTIQRKWQHRVHKTQDEIKHNNNNKNKQTNKQTNKLIKKTTTQKTKKMNNTDPH